MKSQNYNPKTPVIVSHVCPRAHELIKPVLDHWFGDGHREIVIDEFTDAGEIVRSLTRGSGKWKKSVKCVSAVFDQSFSMGVPECLPADHQLVSFVCDPFTLAVDEYQRQSQQSDFWHRGQRIEFSQRFPTLDAFLDRYPNWLYDRLPQNLTLANLSEKMGDEFLFVGVLETLQESVDQLAQTIGQPTMKLTTSWNDGETVVGSESQRQKFYAHYPRPKAIYDFAKAEVARAGEIDSEVTEHHRLHGSNVTTGALDLQAS
jgi:hypothetical protein